MSEPLLNVKNLSVDVEDKSILHGINLTINKGETHVLMGPNGPRVEGLFGAGGAIGNCITNTGLGAHNATALSSGAIAGAAARAYAEKH